MHYNTPQPHTFLPCPLPLLSTSPTHRHPWSHSSPSPSTAAHQSRALNRDILLQRRQTDTHTERKTQTDRGSYRRSAGHHTHNTACQSSHVTSRLTDTHQYISSSPSFKNNGQVKAMWVIRAVCLSLLEPNGSMKQLEGLAFMYST